MTFFDRILINNTHLKTLNLGINSINDDSLISLCNELIYNNTLTSLKISPHAGILMDKIIAS